MLKNFKDLYKLDISGKTRKMDGFDYLNWLECSNILRENGAEDIQHDAEATIWDPSGKYACVKVFVEIDGKRRTITHPVASGSTPILNPDCLQIGFAVQRGFVKCVAINWGLGLSLWEKEATDPVPAPVDNSLGMKVTIEFGKRVQEFGTPEKLHEALGTTKASLAALISTGTAAEKEIMLNRILAIKPKADVF